MPGRESAASNKGKCQRGVFVCFLGEKHKKKQQKGVKCLSIVSFSDFLNLFDGFPVVYECFPVGFEWFSNGLVVALW